MYEDRSTLSDFPAITSSHSFVSIRPFYGTQKFVPLRKSPTTTATSRQNGAE